MKQILKTYSVIIIHLLLGLLVLVATQKLELPLWLNTSALILILFLVINIADELIFKLYGELKEYWGLKKLHYLLIGALAGGLIRLLPLLLSVPAGYNSIEDIHFDANFSLVSIMLTLIVTGWEELWFRGLFLNYCKRNLSAVHISLVIGLLFMLVHLLNPEMNLLRTGPTLFFAGAFLTLLYFRYKTIWLPLGVHFGNNYMGTMIKTPTDGHMLFGSEGYMNAIILAILYCYLVIKMPTETNNPGYNM